MGGHRARGLLVLLACLGRAPQGLADPPPAALRVHVDDGAVAPEGCWALRGGCVGRSGWAATRGPEGPATAAWTWTVPADLGGEIAEEPRVWHDEVFVSLRLAVDKVALVSLDLATGRPRAPPLIVGALDLLDPCATDDGVVVRTGRRDLRLVRVVDGRWATVWTSDAPEHDVASHLAFAGRVHALTGGALVSWRLPERERAWSEAGTFRGTLALHRDRVLAVRYDDEGNAALVGFPAASGGTPVVNTPLGWHGSRVPPHESHATQIAVHEAETVVQHGAGVLTQRGPAARTSLRGRGGVGLHHFEALPVGAPGGWLVYEAGDGGGALALREPTADDGTSRHWPLAAAKDRPEFHRRDLPLAVAGGVAWVAGRGFDVASRRVVSRLPGPDAALRPVPATGHLLTVPDRGRLVAWRATAEPADGPYLLGALRPTPEGPAAPATGVVGRVLFADGGAYVGTFDAAPAEGVLTLRPAQGKPVTRRLDEARLVLADPDRLLYAASLRWLEPRLARLAQLAGRPGLAAALKTATGSRDLTLLEQLIFEALAVGVPEKDVAGARREVQKLKEKPTAPYAPQAAEARRKRAAATAPGPATPVAVLAGLLDDPRPEVRTAVLRRLLALEPAHAGAVAAVRASIPPHLEVPEPFVARDWIDAHDALAAIPTRPVEPPPEGSRPLTPGERELGAARAYWRPDLVGVESAQLLVMTPHRAPDRLGRCLALGELVCTALEQVFAQGQHVRKNRWPLMLQLFETEAEYRKFALGGRPPEETRVWSAGHYDPEAGLSRIYIPAGDADLEQVRTTYVHELTHHWIEERCPLFEAREAKFTGRDVTWIVEGMAELFESFEWDVARRTWTTFVPHARCLEIAAAAPAWADWTQFFDVTYRVFEKLDRRLLHDIRLESELDATLKVSPLVSFYAFSGAVCQYLFHASAAQRQALLEYVRDAYTGKVQSGTNHVRERFGMSPQELAEAARTWARGVVRGEIRAEQVYLR